MGWDELDFTLVNDKGQEYKISGKNIPQNEDIINSLKTYPFDFDTKKAIARKIPLIIFYKSLKSNELISFLRPSQTYGLFINTGQSIFQGTCQLYEEIKIENFNNIKSGYLGRMLFTLIMDDPYFYSYNTTLVEIGTNKINFFEYPYRYKNEYKEITKVTDITVHAINNFGNEDNGFYLKVETSGYLSMLKINNLTTGQSMLLNTTLIAGNIIEIDTSEKWIKLNGVFNFKLKDFYDKWLRLKEGANTISLEAEVGISTISATLGFKSKFINIY